MANTWELKFGAFCRLPIRALRLPASLSLVAKDKISHRRRTPSYKASLESLFSGEEEEVIPCRTLHRYFSLPITLEFPLMYNTCKNI